jgi:hypothetical protein
MQEAESTFPYRQATSSSPSCPYRQATSSSPTAFPRQPKARPLWQLRYHRRLPCRSCPLTFCGTQRAAGRTSGGRRGFAEEGPLAVEDGAAPP